MKNKPLKFCTQKNLNWSAPTQEVLRSTFYIKKKNNSFNRIVPLPNNTEMDHTIVVLALKQKLVVVVLIIYSRRGEKSECGESGETVWEMDKGDDEIGMKS